MTELKIKNGLTLSYDDEDKVVLVDGKPSKDWKPVFIPSGDDVPDFYGFLSSKNQILYDIHGEELKITDDNDIKL